MIIKLLLLAGILAAATFAYRGAPGTVSLAARRLTLAVTLAAAMVAVLFPDLVTTLANLVGVGRGADLVLYGFVLASIFVWIGMYRRLHEIEHRFVELNRSVALGTSPFTSGNADERRPRVAADGSSS